jgi:LacI family transcriptional regulator
MSKVTGPSSRSTRRRRVLVVVDWNSYAMLEGIARFAKKAGWWLDMGLAGNRVPLPARWEGDGIIGLIGKSEELRSLIEQSALPTVLLSLDPADLACPRVVTDHDAIVDMAVKHFESLRFQNYAVFDVIGSTSQRRRHARFAEKIAEAGQACAVFKTKLTVPGGQIPASVVDEMVEFLRGCKFPLGVFCAQDSLAQLVLLAVAQAQLNVPDQVAVLGVDNDHLLCDFSEPTLSSIDSQQGELGYQGAAVLDRLMKGLPTPAITKVAPRAVVARGSTETWATEDELARAALKYIWSEFRQGLQVADVAKKQGISKVALNNRFQRAFNTSVGAEISRRRIEEARRLLSEEGMNASEVCKVLGYENLETFSRAFKRLTGCTATAFRLAQEAKR